MATVDILAAFGYKWGQDGTVEAIDDAQYKAGWSFIGPTPPSVEQFNKVHQIADEKANYLYAQMAAIFTQMGETPSTGDINSLRDALLGRWINTRAFTASGSYTPSVGTRFVEVEVIGAGGAGGGIAAVAASRVAIAAGGQGGARAIGWFPVASVTGQTITVGSAGVAASGAAGGNGGASSIGALIVANGGLGGLAGAGVTNSVLAGNDVQATSTGGNISNEKGQIATLGVAIFGFAAWGGNGGGSAHGNGGTGFALGTPAAGTSGPGLIGGGYGAGGGGAQGYESSPARAGGNGTGGLVIIREIA